MRPFAFILSLFVAGAVTAAHCPPLPPAPQPEPPHATDPLAADLARFPPPTVAIASLVTATGHCRWLADNAALNTDRVWWDDYRREAVHAETCWSLLAEAQGTSPSYVQPTDEWRMECLCWLQVCLGDEDFQAGRMPKPMPCMETW